MAKKYHAGDKLDDMDSYEIPVEFFTDSRYKNMSAEAKVLYGLLRDRMKRDAKESADSYITFPQAEVKEILKIGAASISKAFKELETANLIEREKPRMGNPDRIYVRRVQK